MAELKARHMLGSIEIGAFVQNDGSLVLNTDEGSANNWPVISRTLDGDGYEMLIGDGSEEGSIIVPLPVGSRIEATTPVPHEKFTVEIV